TTASVAPLFGGFGTTTTSAPSTGFTFGGFGQTTTSAPTFGFGTATTSAPAFGTGLGATATTTAPSLFGGGLGSTAPTTTTSIFGGGAFGTQQPALGGLGATTFGGFGAQQQQKPGIFAQPTNAQNNVLLNTATALSMPTVFNDERDAVLARWNQLQAFWGTGKGYYNGTAPPVEFTSENHFCRFKAVGYSCIPSARDEDGLVALDFNKKDQDVRNAQQQLVESLHKILGSKPTHSVNVETVRPLPGDKSEVVIYIIERNPNGTSRRISASELFNFLNQNHVKTQLTQLGVVNMVAKTTLTAAQVKQLTDTPPAGIDPLIWEQAKKDNPDPERLIPVPMIGFGELHRRLKLQEYQTKQHQGRLDAIAGNITGIQGNMSTMQSKIQQYRRKLQELSHRVLEVLIRQEAYRKSGYAIQADEEQLRVQLEAIQVELNAPMQFKGRLNELMSQIRMQQMPSGRAEDRYSMEATMQEELRQHLKQQQEGLTHLISIIKDDMEDLKVIEQGLAEVTQHHRR
ncbi:Nuclear pore complex protein Nup54, partial [Branchiostoma belcheri]